VLTRIDHIMICVPDLQKAIVTYTRLGFRVHLGGVHPGQGTHNAIAFHQDDYLELLAINPAETEAASPRLVEFIAAGGGFRYVSVQSDDLAADVAAMRARGVDVSDPLDGGRRTPGGQELRWRAASLGSRNPLPLFFIQHFTSLVERRRQVPDPGDHPNGVLRTDRVYIAVEDVNRAAQAYSQVLGLPVPRLQHGNVIKAEMAVFDIGATGIAVAQPTEAGPTADSFARRGPGPFQVLYRTRSMEAGARWIGHHGMPPPARGTRNTGEQAILVGPEDTCGLYIGFVGPP
jgi:catechol 2,3-dioxygenase-like lactoylglutathione lyase family enzyme